MVNQFSSLISNIGKCRVRCNSSDSISTTPMTGLGIRIRREMKGIGGMGVKGIEEKYVNQNIH